jgi:two-component system, chemotaxis family, protein-glutamate methylesterase/glutaminase
MIRVLVVDDSGFMRLALRRIIEAEGDMVVVGEAADGLAALEAAERLRPDVVAMDVEMPGLDGLETTARLVQSADPPAVVMVSQHTSEGSATALAALARGAVDCLWKDRSLGGVDFGKLERALPERLRYWAGQRERSRAGEPRAKPRQSAGPCDLVVIGASTGGPDAVAALLGAAGALAVPVVVAQHMPAELGADYAAHLARRLRREVVLGQGGLALPPGLIAILPGGMDGHVVRTTGSSLGSGFGGGFALRLSPGQGVVRPSVDLLLGSAAVAAQRAVGVVLTGMGRDGAAGAALLAERGMPVLVQSPESCVVAGMPGAVIAAGHGCVTGTPEELGRRLVTLVSASGAEARA